MAEERTLRIVQESARKFRVDLPGGGHSGTMTEQEANGYAMGFIRGVGWAKAQIREPEGIVEGERG